MTKERVGSQGPQRSQRHVPELSAARARSQHDSQSRPTDSLLPDEFPVESFPLMGVRVFVGSDQCSQSASPVNKVGRAQERRRVILPDTSFIHNQAPGGGRGGAAAD
ncbi:unnamed protein product [Pleuronectes platessa]|uniref:Uncharacterized protein n=1 Tax=Pleuronectes platessa TaxID=8262 RepID=A0A9N7UA22_PLEPL|nr:unnamed protein product [Pleuronectes platessa]